MITPLLAFLSLFVPLSGCFKDTMPTQEPGESHSRHAPIIGINADVTQDGSGRGNVSTRTTYVDAIVKAGGVPFILPPVSEPDIVEEYVRLCDGFVFIGGGDINPARYGKQPHPTESPLPPRREEFDFLLIEKVLRTRKPFLAICLGCQEVNVALGGALIQDIASQTSTSIRHYPRQGGTPPEHRVRVSEGSRLYSLLGTTEVLTNSSHHQAIEHVGEGVAAVAWAEDGIIEACELRDYPFGLCIQWHPEALTDRAEHLRLFEALIEAAKAHEP